jgi:hypothetical protein
MSGWLITMNLYAIGASLWGLIRLAVSARREAREIDEEASVPVDPSDDASELWGVEAMQGIREVDVLIGHIQRAASSGPAIAWRDVLILGSAVVIGGAANVIPLVWTVEPLIP